MDRRRYFREQKRNKLHRFDNEVTDMSFTNNPLSENKSDPNSTAKEANALKNSQKNDIIKVRKGCKDIWNAYMADGAIYSSHDIPFCPTTATELPYGIVTWEEAKAIY